MASLYALPLAELDAIYSGLPALECKGLCHDVCVAAGMSRAEWGRILEELWGRVPKGDGVHCVLLEKGRCSVYPIRPLVCRLWGLVDHPLMKCPHGCTPERWLTSEEGWALMEEVQRLSG